MPNGVPLIHPLKQEKTMSNEDLEKGIKIRRKIRGDKHVDAVLKRSDPYSPQFQHFINEFSWGMIWARPGLDLKTRALITVGMLCALNRADEFKAHVQGALNAGATTDEIMEVCYHSAVYCGFPAANNAVRMAIEIFKDKGLI